MVNILHYTIELIELVCMLYIAYFYKSMYLNEDSYLYIKRIKYFNDKLNSLTDEEMAKLDMLIPNQEDLNNYIDNLRMYQWIFTEVNQRYMVNYSYSNLVKEKKRKEKKFIKKILPCLVILIVCVILHVVLFNGE